MGGISPQILVNRSKYYEWAKCEICPRDYLRKKKGAPISRRMAANARGANTLTCSKPCSRKRTRCRT